MKYIKETWNDEKQDYVKEEITKEEAKYILESFYKNVHELLDTPNYYRTFFGGIDVTEETKKEIHIEKETTTIYTTYAPSTDITFIMEDIEIDDMCISTEVIGFYHGEPNDEATAHFIGKTRAEYWMGSTEDKIKIALASLGAKEPIVLENIDEGRIKVYVKDEYFGIWDVIRETFVD